MVLKQDPAVEASGSLGKMLIMGTTSRAFHSIGLGWLGLENLHSKTFPGDTDAASLGIMF